MLCLKIFEVTSSNNDAHHYVITIKLTDPVSDKMETNIGIPEIS